MSSSRFVPSSWESRLYAPPPPCTPKTCFVCPVSCDNMFLAISTCLCNHQMEQKPVLCPFLSQQTSQCKSHWRVQSCSGGDRGGLLLGVGILLFILNIFISSVTKHFVARWLASLATDMVWRSCNKSFSQLSCFSLIFLSAPPFHHLMNI